MLDHIFTNERLDNKVDRFHEPQSRLKFNCKTFICLDEFVPKIDLEVLTAELNLLLNNFKRISKRKLGCLGHRVNYELIAITLKVKVRLLLAEVGNVENGHIEVKHFQH